MANRNVTRTGTSRRATGGKPPSLGPVSHIDVNTEHPKDPSSKDPWLIDGQQGPPDCNCPPKANPPTPSRPTPPEGGPKGDDCCRQILEVLRCLHGTNEKCFNIRKPKTKPKVKIANLCGVLPIKERIVPILLLILRRQRAGIPPANAFEKNLQNFLAALPKAHREVLAASMDGYDKLPKSARDCVFETRFDAWPNDKPLDPEFIARNFINEFICLGRYHRYGPDVPISPPPLFGGPRPWEQSVVVPGAEPGQYTKITAPWPWICAISPVGHKAIDETGWFRNESSCVPGNVPRNTNNYFPSRIRLGLCTHKDRPDEHHWFARMSSRKHPQEEDSVTQHVRAERIIALWTERSRSTYASDSSCRPKC